jgi:hypothetical protein
MYIYESKIILLVIYTENKCSMNYAQRCTEKNRNYKLTKLYYQYRYEINVVAEPLKSPSHL